MTGAPLWVYELADTFWGGEEDTTHFPRSLQRRIARSLPITVVSLPALRVASIDQWLGLRAMACSITVPDRSLRACLVARCGHAIIFIDGTDPADEQSFSLAHELAHFLRHYWARRQTVRERLGDRALEVLDGLRSPNHAERSHALLANIPIGFYVHLMARTDDNPAALWVGSAEREADLLALELLAPEAIVRRDLEEQKLIGMGEVTTLLQQKYGLPEAASCAYAAALSPRGNEDSFMRALGLIR